MRYEYTQTDNGGQEEQFRLLLVYRNIIIYSLPNYYTNGVILQTELSSRLDYSTKLNIPILDINCTTKIYNGQIIYKINSFSVVGNLMVLTPIGYIGVID